MGGNAFILAKRQTSDSINKYKEQIAPHLNFVFSQFYFVKSYTNKETHGDLDILLLKSERNKVTELINRLCVAEHKSNSDCLSFLFGDLQVDLIFVNDIEIAKGFYDYGDVGAFMGRLAKIKQWKFTPHGLKFTLKSKIDSNIIYEDVIIETDFEKICQLLDLSYTKYQHGFDTPEDIFEFIICSKYFIPASFMLETSEYVLGHQRRRDVKRPIFVQFELWIREHHSQFVPRYSKTTYDEAFRQFIESNYEYAEKFALLEENTHRRHLAKEKFNATHVQEFFHVDGVLLGVMMRAFNRQFPNLDARTNYILNTSIDDIMKYVHDVSVSAINESIDKYTT